MAIADDVRNFIVENFLFGEAEALPGDDASLIENEILDSTAVLELVSFIEEKFGAKVGDADIVPANFDSVDAIAAFVARTSSSAAA